MDSIAENSEASGPLRGALIPVHEAVSLAASWAALAADLTEENPFFSPWLLLPALDAYADAKVRLACIWAGEALIALLPVTRKSFYARLPIGHWATWTYPHCYYGAPLIRRGAESAAFKALFALLCDGEQARAFVRMAMIDQAGSAKKAAAAAAADERRFAYEAGAISRAALFAGASADATIAVHVRKKKRKELARLRNRLEEQGAVCFRELTYTEELEAWTDAFLSLEDKSWKGRQGTSLKSTAHDTAWFRQTLAGAHEQGMLHFLRFDLDERPVAMLTTLVSNGAAYSLKIAHDPDFARYSPGVMIKLEVMRSLLEREDFQFADSCASPDHSMINGLWRARRVITGLNVSGRGFGARSMLGAARLLERARARLPKG